MTVIGFIKIGPFFAHDNINFGTDRILVVTNILNFVYDKVYFGLSIIKFVVNENQFSALKHRNVSGLKR